VTTSRLGERLVQRGLLTADELETALEHQRRTGERLGRLLLILGFVTRIELGRALAELWGLPFVTVDPGAIAIGVAQRLPLDATLRFRAVPLADDGTEIVVAVADAPDAELAETLRVVYPDRRFGYRVTTEWDIDRAIAALHRRKVADAAIHGLYFRDQSESAFAVFTVPQYLTVTLLALAVGVGLWYAPLLTLLLVNLPLTAAFLGLALFRTWVAIRGSGGGSSRSISAEEIAAIDARTLPVYTVLVSFHREPHRVEPVLQLLQEIDYPSERLDVILLFEEDDPDSLAAAKAATPNANVRLLVVPGGEPQTRARACNVGLLFARGSYLVVFDPRDRPERDQLKKAALTFRRGPAELVCLQAGAVLANRHQNLLTAWSAVEHAAWFDWLLPGMEALRLAVPLGGTSSHFRTRALRALGGWDPFNVTEDADLGLRAVLHGFRIGILPSITVERVAQRAGDWLRERTRWIKGYLQTALVLSHRPHQLVRRAGWARVAGFTCLVAGTPLLFLIFPVAAALSVVGITARGATAVAAWPAPLFVLPAGLLLVGFALAVAVDVAAALRRREYALAAAALLEPVAWLLCAVAAYRALGQLVSRPYYRERSVGPLVSPRAAS
jgi:cellulose synthase/poly-beta-1,6-N-acetylglucosamine synthase-like glycosyltransferase